MNTLPLLVLFALFDLAREDRAAHVGSVAARLAVPRSEVVRSLRHLQAKGLVDAARCRLTWFGLEAAAALRDAPAAQCASRSQRAA